jgi:hypothetical protein
MVMEKSKVFKIAYDSHTINNVPLYDIFAFIYDAAFLNGQHSARSCHCTAVKVFNNHNIMVGEFPTILDAASYHNIHRETIEKSIRFKRFTRKGYLFERV